MTQLLYLVNQMRKEIKIESEDQGKFYPEILMPEAWKDALENADEETLLYIFFV